jgi:hypothetical protein
MKKTLALAAAVTLITATGAYAQAANSMSGQSQTKSNAMMMKGGSNTAKSDAGKMQPGAAADAGADADASQAKPKAHHRMAKNEAKMNASEAETTRQLNEQQAQMASAGGGSNGSMSNMSSGSSSNNGMSNGNGVSRDRSGMSNGMGKVSGANSGVEGRIGGSNSDGPTP